MLANYTTPERVPTESRSHGQVAQPGWFRPKYELVFVFVPRYSREQAERAVAASLNYSETLRKLGLRPAGGNHKLLRHWVDDVWNISTDHFDPDAARHKCFKRPAVALDVVMVENSRYSRAHLKQRLFDEGIKERRCESCGQDEMWRGRRIALILDHINGVPDDHRLENLRVLCPNCAATLETHCGRKNGGPIQPRDCARCGKQFFPKARKARYCSRACGIRWDRAGKPRPDARKVNRPPHEELLREIEATNYRAVGRKYGVTDNAVRKWVRSYEREASRVDGDDD